MDAVQTALLTRSRLRYCAAQMAAGKAAAKAAKSVKAPKAAKGAPAAKGAGAPKGKK